MNNYLNRLLHPIEQSEFLSLYQMNQPFVIHHGEEELRELRDLPLLSSLESLLNAWPTSVNAHLPDLRDEASSVEVNSTQAMKLFKNGMGLLFNDANRFSPVLTEWIQNLRQELGLSNLTYGRSLLYATPDGKGTAPHFDQNINFVLQIHGTKVWTLAPNRSIINPTVRHTMGENPDPELYHQCEEELPTQMPDEVVSFALKPGSLLFVPRGVWHSTEAQGDALALNFTFSPPTWSDLLLSALRSRLNAIPEWRETADGVSDEERRFEAEKKFDYLLSTLIDDLPHWRAGDILEATESVDV